MFFAIDLLIPQHGGKFAIAWLAATRGIHYVPKNEIAQCDIAKLCDEILKMVQSSSSRPRLRLSLSLASRLVNGVIKVYKRQVEITTDELHAFLLQVRTPIIFPSSISSEGTSRSPVPRIRRKRTPKVKQLSNEPAGLTGVPLVEDFTEDLIAIDEATLARPSIHQIDSNLITLREELLIRPQEERAMDGFGVLDDGEPPAFPGALLQVAVHFPSTPEKRKAGDVLGTPSKRRLIRPMAELETPKESEIEPISEVAPQREMQVVPDISRPEVAIVIHEMPDTEEAPQLEAQPAVVPELEVQPAVMPELEPAVMPELEPAVMPELEVEPAKRVPPRRRVPLWVAAININMRRKRVVNINRCLATDRERFDVKVFDDYCPVALAKGTDPDEVSIIGLFMEENQSPREVEELLTELRLSSRNTDSLFRTSSFSLPQPHRRVTSTAPDTTPVSTSAMPAVLDSVVPLKPHHIIVEADVHASEVPEEPMLQSEQVVEPQIPMDVTSRLEVPDKTVKLLAQSTGVSLPLMDVNTIIQPPERTIETVIPPAAETRHLERAVLVVSPTSSDIKKTLSKDRQKRIRDIVKHWNVEEQGEITIEDVCCKPINRTNIALAFNDLLSLHKMKYVKLINKPDSLELGNIEKGERLLPKK